MDNGLNNDLIMHGTCKRYYIIKEEKRPGLIKKFPGIKTHIVNCGELLYIDSEKNKIKLLSYNEKFTKIAKELTTKLPDYDILIVENFE